MNFKERIDKINQINNKQADVIEIKSEIENFDIFIKNKAVEHILKNAISKSKNIVLLCQSICDRTVVCNYLRSFIDSSVSVEVSNNISADLPFISASTVIVPEPNIDEIVKIFELILCDYKSFIFSMNLKSFENVLESFRTLIALNKNNLTLDNVEHLIGMSDALFIFVSRNDDGLFDITDIGKVVYKNNRTFLDVLFSSSKNLDDNIVEMQEISDVQNEEIIVVPDVIDTVPQEVQNNVEESVVEEIPTAIEEQVVEVSPCDDNKENIDKEIVVDEPSVKVNKYKLLKEKRKNKKKIEE